MKQSKHLVVGQGEVGKAIAEVLSDKYEVKIKDIAPVKYDKEFDVLHICFPYFDSFVQEVKTLQRKFLKDGGITIIHATVPVGTSDKCNAVHSPVRGVHPHLAQGIKTFVKYFGGADAYDAAKVFSELGIQTKINPDAKNMEAGKLWDTTKYGWNIILEKAIHQWCEQNGIDFSVVYTDFNKTYNEGYEKLGHPEYKKYILQHKEGKIGGHCVINNCHLLDSEITKFLLEQDRML